jgi:hypothetical protein
MTQLSIVSSRGEGERGRGTARLQLLRDDAMSQTPMPTVIHARWCVRAPAIHCYTHALGSTLLSSYPHAQPFTHAHTSHTHTHVAHLSAPPPFQVRAIGGEPPDLTDARQIGATPVAPLVDTVALKLHATAGSAAITFEPSELDFGVGLVKTPQTRVRQRRLRCGSLLAYVVQCYVAKALVQCRLGARMHAVCTRSRTSRGCGTCLRCRFCSFAR